MRSVSRAVLVAWPLAAGFGLCGLCTGTLPAAAQQDSVQQQFNDVKGAVGLGEDRPPIDFTERPPLVVPPTNALPPPLASSDRLPVVDPDEVARRKALTDSRRPVPPTDPGASATGRSARTYLIDPPAGMRDPDVVNNDRDFDKPGAAEKKSAHRRRAKRQEGKTTKAAAQAAQ